MSVKQISLAEALAMRERYRAAPPTAPTQAVWVSAPVAFALLAQPGCVGVRAYLARRENGDLTTVVIGVTTDGGDMNEGEIYEGEVPCPPLCPPPPPPAL